MSVNVAFTPGDTAPAAVGIVVNVLRATSTIAQALASGYDRVLCCAELEEARAETLILSTTNGTRAILETAQSCKEVVLGSLLNLSAVAAAARGDDVVV